MAGPTLAQIAEAVWDYRVPAGYSSSPTVKAETAAKAATLAEVATRQLPQNIAELSAQVAALAAKVDELSALLKPKS